MVHKIRKQADRQGITNIKNVILYGRPKKMKMMFSKSKPDVVSLIADYMNLNDPGFAQGSSGGGRNNTFYLIAPQLNLYAEVSDKTAGFAAVDPSNHVIKLEIFSESEEHVRTIAQRINQQWEDGIMPHMEWNKLASKFKVHRDDIVAAWDYYLSSPGIPQTQIQEQSQTQEPTSSNVVYCSSCGAKIAEGSSFCPQCGTQI